MKNTRETVLAKIQPPNEVGCCMWSGTKDPDGYPLIKWEGKTHRATRLVWTLLRGEIPPGLAVLHRCDTPRCANIDHLFLGTDADNHADCVSKGRQAKGQQITANRNTAVGARHGSRLHPERLARGERSGMAKLTDAQVSALRKECALGQEPLAIIGRRFGISSSQTYRIVGGKSRVITNGDVTNC